MANVQLLTNWEQAIFANHEQRTETQLCPLHTPLTSALELDINNLLQMEREGWIPHYFHDINDKAAPVLLRLIPCIEYYLMKYLY